MNILYIVTLSAYLVLPGIAIANVIRLKSGPLGWLALSYSMFVVTYVISNQMSLSTGTFLMLVSWILMFSVLAIATNLIRRSLKISLTKDAYYLSGIILCVATYHLIQGAFAEVPSDIYAHLERFQAVKQNFLGGEALVPKEWESLLTSKSRAWYHLLAVVAIQTSATSTQVLESTAIVTNAAFLISVYLLGTAIFRESRNSAIVALAATGFTAIHMGINIFSFIRYYSAAPAIIGFCLYFYAIDTALRLKYPMDGALRVKYILVICLASFAAAINHTQEALFIGVILTIICGLNALRNSASSSNYKTFPYWKVLATLAVIAFFTLYLYANLNLARSPNIGWRLWSFGPSFGVLPEISILNLKFQFIQVVTLWGVLVYSLFLINIHRYKKNIFLLAGMISPLFTTTNPFFVDLFLRLDDSTTLWRLCYIIPIHYVAADLVLLYFKRLDSSRLTQIAISCLVLTLLVSLLLPIKNTWNGMHFSRIPTLSEAEIETSYINYADLISFLETLDRQYQVLTDPMIGYMLTGLTKHHSTRKKFFRTAQFKRFSYLSYEDKPLDKFSGYLLIINQRELVESNTGRLSQHWRANEWTETRHYYPPTLLEHIHERPEVFELRWANNGVSIFEIRAN